MNKQQVTLPVKKYFLDIDILKIIAAFVVILIHVSASYKGKSEGYAFWWNLINFAVGMFVFASGFLQANSPLTANNIKELGLWIYKRFKRIVFPYYIFVPLYLIAAGFVSGWSKVISKIDFEYIYDTVTLHSGVGNNWIPRLFVLMTLVYMLVELIARRWKKAHLITFLICLALTIYMTFDRSSLPFSKINNLPGWLVIYYIGYFAHANYERFKNALPSYTIASGWGTILMYILLSALGLSVSIFNNKYPPTIYYDLHNLAFTFLILWLINRFIKFFESAKLKGVIAFLSGAAYDMFFYHLIILKLLSELKVNIFLDFFIIVIPTLAVIYIKRNVLKVKI